MHNSPIDKSSFLPDFCQGKAVLQLLLLSQLLAVFVVLAGPSEELLPARELVLCSLFLHWISLLSAGALCWLRRALSGQAVWLITGAAFTVIFSISLSVSELAFRIGHWLQWENFADPQAHRNFLFHTALLVSIVAVLLLRYFYVLHAWQREVEALAQARFAALQARIQPHFFFNSLNSVAALISIKPQQAEELLEDLSELFRAILQKDKPWASLQEEVELARTYLRIEQLRLGERLQQDWQLPANLDSIRVPLLCLQPLLENAIYHGIEALPEGGCLRVRVEQTQNQLRIVVTNPLPAQDHPSSGHHLAQDNIRQRLGLLYDGHAELIAQRQQGEYRAELRVPI